MTEDMKLPQKFKGVLDGFVKRLKDIYGDKLISVVLYGSAASGEFADKHSNINLMIVLTDTGLETLAKARGLVNTARFGIVHPVFFTESYIDSSTDVFPIEFLDIKENHAIVYGRDIIKDLKVDTRNLAFQCEQEIKSKLINIKKQYLIVKSKNEAENLLFKTFTSCLHLFRNIIRLKGIVPAYIKSAIISQMEDEIGIDITVFNEILWAKNKKMELSAGEVDALTVRLVRELDRIADTVDKM